MCTPPSVGFGLTRLVGLLLRDVVLTSDEIVGLMAGLLTSIGTPTGTTRLRTWLTAKRTEWDIATCPSGSAITGGRCLRAEEQWAGCRRGGSCGTRLLEVSFAQGLHRFPVVLSGASNPHANQTGLSVEQFPF